MSCSWGRWWHSGAKLTLLLWAGFGGPGVGGGGEAAGPPVNLAPGVAAFEAGSPEAETFFRKRIESKPDDAHPITKTHLRLSQALQSYRPNRCVGGRIIGDVVRHRHHEIPRHRDEFRMVGLTGPGTRHPVSNPGSTAVGTDRFDDTGGGIPERLPLLQPRECVLGGSF